MAPKREKSLLEDPPAASTSEDEDVEEEVEDEEEVEEEEHEVDEEEEGDEEEEEEDDEEEEDEGTTGKPNSSSAVKKPKSDSIPNSGSKPQTPSSDDDEEEEDESEESDSEPTPPKLKPLGPPRSSTPSGVKPIASQPKKTVTKPSTTTTPSASTAKRPLESEKDSKRKKRKVDDEDSNPEESEKRSTFGPKSIFQRLWSDEDEIVVLRGMIEFKKKGVDPFSDLSEFLDSIKKSLHVEVRTEQLNNKIKRLKKKYLNNYKRGKGDEDPVFSKPHEVLSYELMKEIWGGKEGNIRETNGKDGSVVANGKKSKSKKSNNATKTLSLSDISMRESSKLDERNGSLHPCVQEMVHSRNNMNMVGESFLKQGLGLIGDSKTKDLEQKWRSLYAAELQLYLRRVELVREQTIAILDAHKSSDTSEHE